MIELQWKLTIKHKIEPIKQLQLVFFQDNHQNFFDSIQLLNLSKEINQYFIVNFFFPTMRNNFLRRIIHLLRISDDSNAILQ